MVDHVWKTSELGHGETMCIHCMITNREAAVLGQHECLLPSKADVIADNYDPDDYAEEEDEPELIIVCPDDMCRGQFDGEGPPCGRWQDSCVRYLDRSPTAQKGSSK